MKKYLIATTFFNPNTHEYMQPGETIEVDGEQEMTLTMAGVIGEEVKDDANDSDPSKVYVGDSSRKHAAGRGVASRVGSGE